MWNAIVRLTHARTPAYVCLCSPCVHAIAGENSIERNKIAASIVILCTQIAKTANILFKFSNKLQRETKKQQQQQADTAQHIRVLFI